MPRTMKKRSRKAGLPPGTLMYLGEKTGAATRISLLHYDAQQVVEKEIQTAQECAPFINQSGVCWINVVGVHDVEKLAPFGPGNPKPLFVSRGMRVRGDVKKKGKDTLQCWMTDTEGKVTCEVIGFRAYERWQAQARTQREFDIVYQPTMKNANGIGFITLELESWK